VAGLREKHVIQNEGGGGGGGRGLGGGGVVVDGIEAHMCTSSYDMIG